ncbi:hypothetical protein HK100_006272, partial [Physocladia obscura]
MASLLTPASYEPTSCLGQICSDRAVHSSLALVFLLMFVCIPAARNFLGHKRPSESIDSEARIPLIASFSASDADWIVDNDGVGDNVIRDVDDSIASASNETSSVLISFLLVFATVPAALTVANWSVCLLSVAQLVIALVIFVVYSGDIQGNTSDISVQLTKRHYKLILLRLSIFYIISASFWVFMFVVAWPQLKGGRLSVVAAAVLATGGYLMAAIGFLIHASIKTKRIHRAPVDGKIPSPELDASLFSLLTFSWFDPLMAHGYKTDVVFNDLWDINPSEKIDVNMAFYKQIQTNFPGTALLTSIWLINRIALLRQFTLVILSTLLYFSGPFFLNRILTFVTNRGTKDNNEPVCVAYVYVVGIVATLLSRFALEAQINLSARKIGLRVRNTLSGLIYLKSLKRVSKLSMMENDMKDGGSAAKKKDGGTSASIGKIVNLMSVDASSVGDWIGVIYTPFITFIQIVLCVLSLLFVLGWPAISGVVMMVILMFSGAPLANSINKSFTLVKKTKDNRTNAMNELLQGIKIIKLFAWEKQFSNNITRLRDLELKELLRCTILMSMNRVLWVSAPILTTFVTLGTYTKIAGKDLDATTAFTALALFNLLRGPLQVFPDTLVSLLDVWVSVNRIKEFLLEDELDRFATETAANGRKMVLKDATFEWPAEKKTGSDALVAPKGMLLTRIWHGLFKRHPQIPAEPAPTVLVEQSFKLTDISIEFPESKLTVVVGATGSGKTSLILSLLGETTRFSGTCECASSVAYVSQTAWLTNATIRENILFGTSWDPVRYRRVIQACALVKDFELLNGGDMTEVGEKGINLSGGQKQRISLARAAYSRSIAVDAPTARHLFEQCVLGLMSNRTRILVTNAVGLTIPCADHLVMIEGGCVFLQGSVEFVVKSLKSQSEVSSSPFSDGVGAMAQLILSERKKFLSNPLFNSLAASVLFLENLDKNPEAPVYTLENDGVGSKLTDDETMESGNVKWEVYGFYIWAMGGIPFLLLLLGGYSLNHGLAVLQDFIISWWSNEYKKKPLFEASVYLPEYSQVLETVFPSYIWTATNGTESGERGDSATNYYLTLYGIVGAFCMLAILGRLLILNYGVIRAGRAVHAVMLKKILKTPLRYFEVTPLGRIMNRFTKDIASVDREVGTSTGNTVYNVVAVTFVVGSIMSVIPALILLLIPLAYIYIRVGLYYIRTSRALKRIDSVMRSPIFSHFSETLNGVTTIRAFNEIPRFTAESSRRFDVSNRATYFLVVSNLWLSIRIQSLSAFVVGCAAALIIMTGINAGLAGLCLNFTLQLTDNLISISWMEMAMNSVGECA